MSGPSNPRGVLFSSPTVVSSTEEVQNASRYSALPVDRPFRASDHNIELSYLRSLRYLLELKWTFDSLAETMNQFDQYLVDIRDDDAAFTMYYIRMNSAQKGATPLLMLHDRLGSVYDFHKVISTLVAPPDGKPAFHVIVPSLPGFFLSTHPRRKTWNLTRTAKVLDGFMTSIFGESIKYAVHAEGSSGYLARYLGAKYSDNITFVHITYATPITSSTASENDNNDSNQESTSTSTRSDQTSQSTSTNILTAGNFTLGYAIGTSPLSLLSYLGEFFRNNSDPDGRCDMDVVNTAAMYFISRSFVATISQSKEDSVMIAEMQKNPTDYKVKCKFGYTNYKYGSTLMTTSDLLNIASSITYYAVYDYGGHFPALDASATFVADLWLCYAACNPSSNDSSNGGSTQQNTMMSYNGSSPSTHSTSHRSNVKRTVYSH